MKIKTISFALLNSILLVGCAPPTQPDMTVKERIFIELLEQKNNCQVEREIDPILLKKAKGNYFLGFSGIHCEMLEKKGLREYSQSIAKGLYNVILEKNASYDEITVNYECNPRENQFKSKHFDFIVDSLR